MFQYNLSAHSSVIQNFLCRESPKWLRILGGPGREWETKHAFFVKSRCMTRSWKGHNKLLCLVYFDFGAQSMRKVVNFFICHAKYWEKGLQDTVCKETRRNCDMPIPFAILVLYTPSISLIEGPGKCFNKLTAWEVWWGWLGTTTVSTNVGILPKKLPFAMWPFWLFWRYRKRPLWILRVNNCRQ